jgi:glucose-1-phosphate adenylyltransferase
MLKKKILALILAGGQGGRLGILTENRAKPVVPFAGFYRLIDFALSNCAHSGISDVWVVEQYELHSLNEHLSNGKPWDLDRTYGGLQILPPFENREDSSGKSEKSGFAEGNADALFRQIDKIKKFAPDILIVLSSDHIYKIDFRDVIETHLQKDAAVTMVTTKVPKGESASRFSVVKANKDGRVTDFAYKPENPQSEVITTEIFVYDAKILIETLEQLKKDNKKLKDYGDELLPFLVKNETAVEHRHDGYWRDVGTIESFWQANMDLLDEKRKLEIDDPNWAILTRTAPRVPALIYDSANITESLIAHGAKIYGAVKNCVLSAGVVVEEGAEIEECVVFADSTIKKGVKLKRAIVDEETVVTAKKIQEVTKNQKKEILVVGQKTVKTSAEIKSDAEKKK